MIYHCRNKKHWLDQLEPLRSFPKDIHAESYNRIRIAILRLGKPLNIELTGMRGVDAILDDHAWVCFDPFKQPLLAWTNFNLHQREGLHIQMHCELRLFHCQAGLIMGSALDALEYAAVALLNASRPKLDS